MCGIVGYIGRRDAVPVILEGLRSLEYRGYDSAGLAVVHRNRLQVTKTAGRVQELRDRVVDRPTAASGRTAGTKATIGIGHTRWATHGEPNEVNAHPHTDTEGRIAVVHNGIIENAEQLREALIAGGVKLVSETVEEFVRRRHIELQQRQRKNHEIWPLIAAELGQRRFTAPGLSERQLRRSVYG